MYHIKWMRAPDAGGGAGGGTGAAAPATDPAAGAAAPPAGADKTTDPAKAAEKPTFADLLKDPAYKTELDRMLSEGATAARTEAERLAKLSAAEREAEERKQFEAERMQFARERLENEATKQLASQGLPVEFAGQLVGKDAAETLQNVQAFGTAFTAAVEQAVIERIKGAPPKTGAQGGTDQSYVDTKYKNSPYYGKGL